MNNPSEFSIRLQRGDEEAWTELLNEYEKNIRSFVRMRFPQVGKEGAEDVVQQIFTKAWKFHSNYDPKRPIKGYLYTIAANCIKDELDKYYREQDPRQQSSPPNAPQKAPLANFEPQPAVLRRAFVRLSDTDRQLVCDRVICELPEAERNALAAESLGITVKAVKVRMYRAMKKLVYYYLQELDGERRNDTRSQ